MPVVATLTTVLVLAAATSVAQPTADSFSGWRYGAFLDVAYLRDPNEPENRRFRNRGTTPRVNGVEVNMAGAWLRKIPTRASRSWDRDGRWIAGELGFGQSIAAVTSTAEYRFSFRRAATIVRLEHRYDRSAGAGAGFDAGAAGLSPRQHLWILAVTASTESAFPW